MNPPHSSDDLLVVGRSLDSRFTLLRPLGKGGMGEVWLVRDDDLEEELVAKIVPRDASDDRLALLRRECRHARRLVHPNIVRVFDFHRGDAHGFVTMDFVDGEPLDRLRGRPIAEILEAVARVADALAYAHDQGVVHRDLKAANVVLGADGQPRVLDFGIAGLSGESEELTVTGGGSRYSVSPQQLDGRPPQAADDIYALGVLIYQLITGHPPFWPEITDRDIRCATPDPMTSNHPLPAALTSLVGDLLRKSPADRPADMRAVLRRLEEIRLEEIRLGRIRTADGRTAPELTAPPRLTPPPRPASQPPVVPIATAPTPTPGRETGRGPMWITALVFALLAVIATAVLVVLPGWVRSRQQVETTEIGPDAGFEDDGFEQAGLGELSLEPAEPPRSERPPEHEDVEPELATQPPVVENRQPPRRIAAPAPPARPASEFEQAMSAGLTALDRGDYAAAREAFARASGLRPDAPQSADGLARAETGLRLATIHRLRQEAHGFETAEDWLGAAERYQQVLGLDPTIEFAQAGRVRSRDRAELSASLDFHIANPARLSSEQVLPAAAAVLTEASEIDPAGPRLRRQIEGLTAAVQAFSTPVKAYFESDNLTEVVVYRVGRLGTFSRRALDLRPGTYTVVGSRRGYRDVRRKLVIEPGVEPAPLAVRCQEQI